MLQVGILSRKAARILSCNIGLTTYAALLRRAIIIIVRIAVWGGGYVQGT